MGVVGIDVFPTNPIGIAFCKPNWDDQLQRGSASLFMLEALGIDVFEASEKYPAPRDFFFALAIEYGISFVNASNHFVEARIAAGH